MVDVLFDDVVAGEPVPVDPVADHPLHVGPAVLPGAIPEGALVPERAHRQHVADGAIQDAIAHLDSRGFAAQLRPGHHRQPFGGGLLGRGQHRPHAGGVHCNGLFEEAVFAGGHRGGKMRRTEMWRRAMQHHVDTGIDQLQVSVKSREASAFGDVDALFFLQLLACRRDTVGEDVSERSDLQSGSRVEVVDHRATAAAAAADEPGLERAAVGRACRPQRLARRGLRPRCAGRGHHSGRDGGDRTQKVTAIHGSGHSLTLHPRILPQSPGRCRPRR